MRYKNGTDGRVASALRAVLPRVVDIVVAPVRAGSGVDLVVNGLAVHARWAGQGRLAEVKAIVGEVPRRPGLVVVAQRLSPGAREMLSESGIGWVDETGAAEIALRSLVVSRSGRPDGSMKRPAHWTPSVVAVAEALLCGSGTTVKATAAATGLSTGSCISALRALTELGHLRAEVARGPSSARTIVDRRALLQGYSTAALAEMPRLSFRAGATWRDTVAGVAELGRQWDAADLAWAATGAVASAVLAPHLTQVNAAEVYIDASTPAALEAACARAGLRAIEGGRILVRPFPTVATRLLARAVKGMRVAPWPRVYADLQNVGVRGEEAAEHLREVMNG